MRRQQVVLLVLSILVKLRSQECCGGGAQVNKVASWLAPKTVAQVAELAAKGNAEAKTAIKIIKDAPRLSQKWGAMIEEFDQFDCAMATPLQEIRMSAQPDLPNGIGVIELRFANCAVFVCIEDEDDTLTLRGPRSADDIRSPRCWVSFPAWSAVGRAMS
jgi:hypothetical protein